MVRKAITKFIGTHQKDEKHLSLNLFISENPREKKRYYRQTLIFFKVNHILKSYCYLKFVETAGVCAKT